MPTSASMKNYYQARAKEYEDFYALPERRSDLEDMKCWLAEKARGRCILEVASGTGYWTAVAAPVAKRIQGTDINTAPLEIARSKDLGAHVSFVEADAYDLPEFEDGFDCGMAHFWWSHVAKSRQDRFLTHFASRLGEASTVLMVDNNYVEGSNIPLTRQDDEGNTYQTRTLSNGDRYEVLKNFPTGDDIETVFSRHCSSVDVRQWTYFWAVSAVLRVPETGAV